MAAPNRVVPDGVTNTLYYTSIRKRSEEYRSERGWRMRQIALRCRFLLTDFYLTSSPTRSYVRLTADWEVSLMCHLRAGGQFELIA